MAVGIKIDELLYKLLAQQDLLQFAPILARESVTKIDHLKHVKEDELASYGLSSPAIRRLLSAFLNKELQKKIERRIKKKKEIKYVDISNLEEYKRPTSNPVPTQIAQQQHPPQVDQNRMPTPTNEEVPSTSSQLVLIMKDDIKLMEGLGEGTFAVVKKAKWHKSDHEKIDVAVKIIREATEEVKQDLINEIKLMSRLHHPNLIQLYGVVLGDPMLMVLEFCDGGALLDRLRTEEKPTLLATQLINYSQQIASGMTHLEQKGYVHRDLATRNVLLTKNEQQIKICDFGLSRVVDENNRLYNMQTSKKVPFSWCPPESLRFRRFSSASDVWAFGVTLWELWTNGEEPWIGFGAVKVLEAAERGERLRRPENAPNSVYDIMYSCWASKSEERPDFTKLYQLLSSIKFDTVEIKTEFFPTIPAHVEVKQGQKFIVLEERSPTTIHGQNVTTRKYGLVPKAILGSKTVVSNNQPLQPKPQPVIIPIRPAPAPAPKHQPPQQSQSTRPGSVPLPTTKPIVQNRSEISLVPNSVIHAGHGDSDWTRSWGDPQKIPEVYLKNPVTNPVIGTDLRGGIPLTPLSSNIPTKPSLPRNPPNHLPGSIATPLANKELPISSIEQWNRVRMSTDVGLIMKSERRNNSPQAHVNKPVENVTMRNQPVELNQRPKTTIGGPPFPNHHADNIPNNRKITMEEIQREREAFQWVTKDLATNKQFMAAVKTKPTLKTTTENGNVENKNFLVASAFPKESKENGKNEIMPKVQEQLKPMPSIFTELPAEQSKTLQSTGFSPRSMNGRDPFEVPAEAKSLISRPFTINGQQQNQIQKPTNIPPLPLSNPPNFNPLTTTTVLKMDPSPTQRPFHTLGKESAKRIANDVLKETESRNGSIQTTPQQMERIYPSLDELMYPDRKANSMQNGQTNHLNTQNSWISPQSSLLLVDTSKRTDTTRPRPNSVTAMHTNGVNSFSTMSMITNGSIPRPFQQQPQIQQPTLPLTELPKKRVIPGTAPPSGAGVEELITMLTTPSEQQKQSVGWDPNVVGRLPLIQSNFQTPISPHTPIMPTPNTATIVENKPLTALTNSSVNIYTDKYKLLEEVRKQVPIDTNIEDCKKALVKHRFNVTMAIRDLKVQKLLLLNVTKDPDLAASALDSCKWNLDEAVNRLLP